MQQKHRLLLVCRLCSPSARRTNHQSGCSAKGCSESSRSISFKKKKERFSEMKSSIARKKKSRDRIPRVLALFLLL